MIGDRHPQHRADCAACAFRVDGARPLVAGLAAAVHEWTHPTVHTVTVTEPDHVATPARAEIDAAAMVMVALFVIVTALGGWALAAIVVGGIA